MTTSRRSFITRAMTATGAIATSAVPGLDLSFLDTGRLHRVFGDDFLRTDREGWGHPWFMQRYGRRWSIDKGKGVLRFPPRANTIYYRPCPIIALDHDVAEVEMLVTVSSSNVTARIGALARAVGYADYYAAYLGPGKVLRVTRCGVHDEKVIGKAKVQFGAHLRHRIRMQVLGSGPVRIRAKAWIASEPEPEGWQVEGLDSGTDAITDRGALGIFTAHAIDGRGAVLRVFDVAALSTQGVKVTQPSIAYSLVGPPNGPNIRAVAQTAVPAHVGFQYSTDPTFASRVHTASGGTTRKGHMTAKGDFDLSEYTPGTILYWRAFAERRGNRVFGPTGKFKKSPEPGAPVRIAFGSCTKWDPYPHTSFEHARLRQPDFYLHQGDLGYVAHRVADQSPDYYQDHWTRMLMDPSIAALCREAPFGFYRDDTEYGINNADAFTLRRFVIDAHTEMNANPRGAYFNFRYGDVAVFALDCRRFSSGRGPKEEDRYKLGPAQKKWLIEGMKGAKKAGASLIVVASPQAFGADPSPGAWNKNYPAEWSELMDFFIGLGRPVLILSGDAHGHRLHEYPQKFMDSNLPRVLEFTSAGTEQTKFGLDPDPGTLIHDAHGSAFGSVDIGPEQEIDDSKARVVTVTAVKSEDGTALWTESYLSIHNVGILPL